MNLKDTSEILKNFAQVAAWLTGALFFLFKFLQGYLVVDMSTTVVPSRQASSKAGTDYLVAAVSLKKGQRGSFRLHDARVLVTQGEVRQESRLGFERYSFRRTDKLLSLNFDRLSSRVPTLNLAAGESMETSVCFSVGSDQPCLVEVIVMGTGFFSLVVGQWRASSVSLPVAEKEA